MSGMEFAMGGPAKAKDDRMSMVMAMDMMGREIATRTVIDSNGISWTESNATGQTTVSKLDMKVMAELSEEIAGVDIPGFGGGMPMDMTMDPSKLLDTYASMYDMEMKGTRTEDGTEVYVLGGAFKEDVAANLDPTGTMAAMGIKMKSIEVLIGKADAFPRKMAMFGEGDTPFMVMTFKNIVLNPEIADSEFEYTPPDGVQVMDNTEILRAQLEALKAQQTE
jgi:hypothetical protein